MRLIRMNPRSRYNGKQCLHCHKQVAEGRVGLASTYYIYPSGGKPFVTTKRLGHMHDNAIEVRVMYHRACIEKILAKGILDPEVEKSLFEEYRESLAEQYEPV